MISACFAILFLIAYSPLHAQIEDPADKTKNEGEHRVNKNVDKGIDKGFDKVEEGIGNLFKKKKKKDKGQQEEAGDQQGGTDQDRQTGSKDLTSV